MKPLGDDILRSDRTLAQFHYPVEEINEHAAKDVKKHKHDLSHLPLEVTDVEVAPVHYP